MAGTYPSIIKHVEALIKAFSGDSSFAMTLVDLEALRIKLLADFQREKDARSVPNIV